MKLETNILCGDATTIRELEEGSIDLLLTEVPPFDYEKVTVYGYMSHIRNVFGHAFRLLKDGRFAVVVAPPTARGQYHSVALGPRVAMALEEAGFHFGNEIRYQFREGHEISPFYRFKESKGQPRTYRPDPISKSIFVVYKGEKPTFKHDSEWVKYIYKKPLAKDINTLDNYTEISTPDKGIPVEYYEDWLYGDVWKTDTPINHLLIQLFSYAGEAVLDPFPGSGEFIREAQILNRSVYTVAETGENLNEIKRILNYGQSGLLVGDIPRIFLTKVW